MTTKSRTRESASLEYEASWSDVLEQVDEMIAAGETDPERIIERAWNGKAAAFFESDVFRYFGRRVGVAEGSDGRQTHRLVVERGKYRLVPTDAVGDPTAVRELIAHIESQTEPYDCIIELGSGFGRNLLGLHAALPNHLRPAYHACELTEAGRSVTERLHGLVEGMSLRVHHFDYYQPRFDFLTGGERVLVFSAHSIEQIPTLGREVFDEVLRRSGSCAGLHFEAVGWQAEETLMVKRAASAGEGSRLSDWMQKRSRKFAKRIDRALGTTLRARVEGLSVDTSDIDSAARVSANAAAWSGKRDYNTNLLPLLRALETEGRVAIDRIDVNISGENPFNPTTVVGWRST